MAIQPSRTPHTDRLLAREGCTAFRTDRFTVEVRGPGVRLGIPVDYLAALEFSGSGPIGFDRDLAILIGIGIDVSRDHPELLAGTAQAVR